MVIVQKSSGQLGNKLLISAHATAYCLSRHETLLNAVLGYDAIYFSASLFARNRIFVVNSKRLQWIFSKCLRGIKQTITIFRSRPLFDEYQVGWVHTELNDLRRGKKNWLLLEGEGFRSSIDVQRNQATIRSLFSPKTKYIKQVDRIIVSLKEKGSLLVGIHLRKGDYKDWKSGEYYFDDLTYMNYIEQAKRLFKNQSVGFILCSDEPINKNLFQSETAYISTNEVIVDLYLLAKCDYLIGPPSTFSGWASFYGDVPLCVVESKDAELTLSNFKRYTL
ncbi:alpha-1,2-fucosyltransferase [Spirosoma endbachense]|uniref:Alpha-1,2-fucosyltransferase n=1 Tax=Spirosoma endbachense TaxID=2666025 RepID=A0A6P1VQB0_9BACT|nr:alpha-1,2-fucosyltransferase [Spirosoma endbachense]QHV95273.1 hypothetical protein GJR95_09720 [Spirosoma endbachense]